MNFAASYLSQAQKIMQRLDTYAIERMVKILRCVRDTDGRLFVVGSGGGAGHASHAVCDFRKVCGIEAYCPTDNVSELTARINDEGWDVSIANWLKVSRFSKNDALFVFSVGGGSEEKHISTNLIQAVKLAKEVGAKVVGVVGRDGGFTAKQADACVIIPTVDSSKVTPHTESFQALTWHLIVSHPELQIAPTMWESTQTRTSKVLSLADSVETIATNNPSSTTVENKIETKIFDIKIFADGAERAEILALNENPFISGFTTNPTLMKKAGIKNYKAFALDILSDINAPISFEVFSDDFTEMEHQAQEIASWGENVYVKIPITNTKRESSVALIQRLSEQRIKLNVTAIMTLEQVEAVLPALKSSPGAYISIFAGRIADTGRDPMPLMTEALRLMKPYPNLELIWASPRELLNIVQANEIGCHVITVTNDILKKLKTLGKDLADFSLETVKMFYDDATAAGFSLKMETEDDRCFASAISSINSSTSKPIDRVS